MKIKILALMALFVVAPVVLMGAVGSARADEWFVLGEQTIKSADPSVEIKSTGGRLKKDVKQVKFSVEGGEVEITNAVLHWDNRPDDKIMNVGTVKSGGETAPKNAPGIKGRLTGVTLQYKIISGSPTVKVWGYD